VQQQQQQHAAQTPVVAAVATAAAAKVDRNHKHNRNTNHSVWIAALAFVRSWLCLAHLSVPRDCVTACFIVRMPEAAKAAAKPEKEGCCCGMGFLAWCWLLLKGPFWLIAMALSLVVCIIGQSAVRCLPLFQASLPPLLPPRSPHRLHTCPCPPAARPLTPFGTKLAFVLLPCKHPPNSACCETGVHCMMPPSASG